MRKLLSFLLVSYCTMHCSTAQVNYPEPAFDWLSSYLKVRDFTIGNESHEAYFTVQSSLEEISVIVFTKKIKGIWSKPEIMPFSGKYADLEPSLSEDNLRLYFASNRPLGDLDKEAKDFDIWYVERENTESPWSSPHNPGPPVNSEYNEFYPSATRSGNLYITSDRPGSKGQDDIFILEWGEDTYSDPVSLNESINTEGYEFNAYVSPDESFIIFSGYNRNDGYGSGDLYISYRDANGNWSMADNLGEVVNSRHMDYCPFMDLNTNTLYFTSRRSSLQGVNDFKTTDELIQAINTYENGQSRIYKIHFEVDYP